MVEKRFFSLLVIYHKETVTERQETKKMILFFGKYGFLFICEALNADKSAFKTLNPAFPENPPEVKIGVKVSGAFAHEYLRSIGIHVPYEISKVDPLIENESIHRIHPDQRKISFQIGFCPAKEMVHGLFPLSEETVDLRDHRLDLDGTDAGGKPVRQQTVDRSRLFSDFVPDRQSMSIRQHAHHGSGMITDRTNRKQFRGVVERFDDALKGLLVFSFVQNP